MAAINESSLRKMLSKVYKYRDLTARDITSVASHYKDLKPVMDNYDLLKKQKIVLPSKTRNVIVFFPPKCSMMAPPKSC